jgi:ATP adenylyltransferase
MGLIQAILDTSRRAVATGALQPIETETFLQEDAGVHFILRTVSGLARKEKARAAAPAADPLGDFDPELFVADLGSTHYVLLNKFNVVAGHALIVTRRFEPQESLLTLDDFEALDACLRDVDGLAFYNGGQAAGASQARKHLQLVPLPLASESPDAVPIERVLGSDRAGPAFAHAYAALPERTSAEGQHAHYLRLLRQIGVRPDTHAHGGPPAGAYNLLVRRRWMLVVPRARACFGTIPVNALGFAGSLFVPSRADLELARAIGPMQVLRGVAGGGVDRA